MKSGKLYLIPNVISDGSEHAVIPVHVKEVISDLKFFLVENVRTTRRYISSLRLGMVINDLKFDVLDKNTPIEQIPVLMQPILQGEDIGIISESGCPGIADPGSVAVAYAHRKNIQVIPLVGPSSILMALMASGFNGQSFVFHGYLPIDKSKKKEKLKSMEQAAIKMEQTQVFMDTPYRNQQLLEDIIATCKPNTLLSIAKDITGKNEMISTRTIAEWKRHPPSMHKIPVIFSLFV